MAKHNQSVLQSAGEKMKYKPDLPISRLISQKHFAHRFTHILYRTVLWKVKTTAVILLYVSMFSRLTAKLPYYNVFCLRLELDMEAIY